MLAMPFVGVYTIFPLIKFIHIEHHRNTNEPMTVDPDNWTSAGPWWQLPFRWATIDLWYLVFYLSRARSGRERSRSPIVALRCRCGIGLLAWAPPRGTAHRGRVLYLLPQRLGMTVLAWWFDYLPHHGLTVTQREDKYQATRVRVGGE